MSIATTNQMEMPLSQRGTPTWEMALNYPLQGDWREEEYLALDTGRLIEFTDGVLEFLPMPTYSHQDMMLFLYEVIKSYVVGNGIGRVYVAPCPVRLRQGKLREPDVFVLSSGRMKDRKTTADGADLVVEVVSEGRQARNRDLVEKRVDYAEAGIPEYRIVDPETTTVTVLVLEGNQYRTHGEFQPGDTADSVLFPGLEFDVKALFDAGEVIGKQPSQSQSTP